jgi:sugar lactone lactonase YvrE
MTDTQTPIIATFELPGDAVFPESIGLDRRSGAAYAGSLADGSLYRLTSAGEVETVSSAGSDGRRSVAGVKVDDRGRLWAAGGYEGTLYVYELEPWRLIARHDVGQRPSCVNDIAFGPDGDAYVTDSLIPILFRADPDASSLEPFVDLARHGVPWPEGLNLNGIVLAPDGKHLVACQTNTGRFWRVSLNDATVDELVLDGGPLEHCDGLAIDGARMWVAVNARDEIAVVQLADDGASGVVRRTIRSNGFRFPTAITPHSGRLLVVNGQLDRMGATPDLPFTVVAIEEPSGPRGDVGTEIAPEAADNPVLARHIDDLLHRTCTLARALTGAEQAALKVDLDGDGTAARKFFNLSARYDAYRDFRVDPRGLGLHGIAIPPGEVVRLTQAEVETHPAYRAFGPLGDRHPPLRGWLAASVCSEHPGRRSYGLLQLSDKAGGGDFTADDADRLRELAAFTGAALDAIAHAARVPQVLAGG